MDIDDVAEPLSLSSSSGLQHHRSDHEPGRDGLQMATAMNTQAHQYVNEGGEACTRAPAPEPIADLATNEASTKSATPQIAELSMASSYIRIDTRSRIGDTIGAPQRSAAAVTNVSSKQAEFISETRSMLPPTFDLAASEQGPRNNDSVGLSSCSQGHEPPPPHRATSAPSLEDPDRSIERCREILLPIILQNLDSRSRSGLMSSDEQTLKPAITSVLTDARCVEFMQLSQMLQAKLAGEGKHMDQEGLPEHHIRDFMDTIRAGVRTFREESGVDGLARFKRTVVVDGVFAPDDAPNIPLTTSSASTDPVDSSIGNISAAPHAVLDKSNIQDMEPASIPAESEKIMKDTKFNSEYIHRDEINRTLLNPTAFGNGTGRVPLLSSTASADPLPRAMSSFLPQSSINDGDIDHEMEEGELLVKDRSVSAEHPLFDDLLGGSLIPGGQTISIEDDQENKYMSEKRQGKRRAVEEGFEGGTAISYSIEDGEVVDLDEHRLRRAPLHREEPRTDSTPSLSPSPQSPGTVPGIWFVKVGEQCSDILKATFVVDKEIEEGIERWCRRDPSEYAHRSCFWFINRAYATEIRPWQKQISLHVQCILKTDVIEANRRLEEQDCSESEVTQTLWEIPCHWPSAGQLLVQVNIDRRSEGGKTWLAHQIVSYMNDRAPHRQINRRTIDTRQSYRHLIFRSLGNQFSSSSSIGRLI
jgi:hypothetical protein